MSDVCLICKSDTSDWTPKQKESHGVHPVVVQWPVPDEARQYQYEVHICRMCQIGLYEVYVDPFIEEHHQPVVDKLNKVIEAVQEALK